jgi:phosphodiesterase/alkaline phosphatase D-like protein
LQRLRGSAGFYSHWDDHEFVNDFSREENSFSSAPNVNGETLYKAGVKAFRDYSPVSYTSRDGIYRTRRWGRNLELFFLDQRSFRSAKADVGTSCNNPATGSADQAPTAPQSVRDVFGILPTPLRQPVSPQCLATIRDPNRTFLGKRQLNRFLSAIKNSTARFKVIMNELPILQYTRFRTTAGRAMRQSACRCSTTSRPT